MSEELMKTDALTELEQRLMAVESECEAWRSVVLEKKNLAKLREPFPPDELEWKIQTCGVTNNRAWALIVPYIQSRAIMNRLDEVVGADNWKNDYYQGPSGHGVMCGLSIRVDGEWIAKHDGAEESDIEAVKGGFSNSLKRTAVVWGMGRELYDMEAVWADTSMEKPPKDEKSWKKAKTKDKEHEFWWRIPAEYAAGKAVGEDTEARKALDERLERETSPKGKYQLTPDEQDEADRWMNYPPCAEFVVSKREDGKAFTMQDVMTRFIAKGAKSQKQVADAFAECRAKWGQQ